MGCVPPPRPVSWDEMVCARLRNGATWEEAARLGPPGMSMKWFRAEPHFRRAYEEGWENRLIRHAYAEARREVASWFTGEVYQWRPFGAP